VSRRLASVEAAERQLGFRARISLEDGLRALVSWWHDQRSAAHQ
jgi:UDP-glucose 4-epimerase